MSDRNAFINKVKNRQFAIAHSWRGSGKVQESTLRFGSGIADDRLWSELQDNLTHADENRYVNEYMPVELAKINEGKVKIFIKRALHKLLKIFFGWYFFPLIDQQNRFNGKLLNAVSLESQILAGTQEELSRLSQRVDTMSDDINKISARLAVLTNRMNDPEKAATMVMDDDFYHDFEERFRGSREDVKNRLQVYVPRVQAHLPDWSKCNFVDIGSGRGEWLDILREHGAINYVGVDLNERQNEVCREFGHTAVCQDCVSYLKGLPAKSVDMVSGIQIIEHLPMGVLCTLLEECHRVLKKGGVILFETPNPRNVTVGAYTFYNDPGHIRPLDPLLVQYLAKHYGFENAEIIDANTAGFELLASPAPDMDKLVETMNNISWSLYGPQDYTIFAVKE